jgi:hypothetical protein
VRRLLELRDEVELVAACGDLESLLGAVDGDAPDVARAPPARLPFLSTETEQVEQICPDLCLLPR